MGVDPNSYAIFTAEVNPTSANNLVTFLLAQAAAGITRLTLAMSCPGGHVVSGITIYNTMLAMPYEIITHNIGNVDSIANVIFLAGKERYACAASTFMFHSVGFNAIANQRLEEKNLRELLDSVQADHKRICEAIAARTKIPIEEGIKLFNEQRTRDAMWAKSTGVIADVREFSFPTNRTAQMFQ